MEFIFRGNFTVTLLTITGSSAERNVALARGGVTEPSGRK
jgi:hypothetical protein